VRYRVRHLTSYAYEETVSVSQNEVRLLPRELPHQRVRGAALRVDPSTGPVPVETDYFGNATCFFTLAEPHIRMQVEAASEVEVVAPGLPDPADTPAWELRRDRARCDLSEAGLAAHEMVFESPYVALVPEVAAYAAPSFPPGRPVLEAALDLMARIHRDFEYRPGATSVDTGLAQLLADRRGVCQDFAHLGIGCLRALGLPARYVSGYLRTEAAPGSARLVGADASHAWLALDCGEAGWVDLDPTNDRPAGEEHVTLAFGRDYGDVSPIKGVILGGGEHTLEVSVEVTALSRAGGAGQPIR
jgi:transglutaminase-like putative cysteine protease